jgi:AcrR family transcriptional regulator
VVAEIGAENQTRAERKERTRQRLLEVTLRLIEDRSLASLSLREVAKDAGIVPTAFYRHYASMDALGVDLVDVSMRPLRQMIRVVRRAIATELRLFTSELTVDLARLTAGFDWTTEDLEMAAGLMVAAMLSTVMDLLEADERHPEDTALVVEKAERQLRLIALGMGAWRPQP